MNAFQSPLFEPVYWRGSGFEILDEIQVPEKIEYIQVTEVAQALDAVRHMKTRAFGQVLVFLYSGALIAERYSGDEPGPLREALVQMTQQFCEARPTFDFAGLGCALEERLEKLPSGPRLGAAIAAQAREFGRQIIAARSARAKRAASLLPNVASVLTHCNVSGELVAIARCCQELGKKFSVIATETRPYLQGTRLTAWELAQAGVPVSLIPDCAIAQVMAKGEVDGVIVGADRSAQNGDIINKVGTYPIARLAKEYGVPFYALVQDPHGVERGSDVPIEERPAHELLMFQGQPLVRDSDARLSARYPSFDVTPAGLISYLVGFEDIYTPESFRRKYQARIEAESGGSKKEAKYLLLYGVPPKSGYDLLREAVRTERAASLLVPEMRPELWGAHVVARELLTRELRVTLISDNMMGILFAQGEISKLCFFYSSLADHGPRGICGSLLAVQLARLHGVPIELFSAAEQNVATADWNVTTFLGRSICPENVMIRPLETEIVPWRFLKD